MAEGGRSVGSVSVSVVPDATGFVEKLKAELEAGTKEIGSAIGRNIGQNMADAIKPYLDEIKVRLDELGAREVKIKAKVDDNGSIARTEAELAALNNSAASGGNGFNLFGSKIANIGLAAVAAADIAIPAILAIGAAAAGALAGLGVLGLGFSGIGAALEAHGKPSGGGGGGGASAGLSQQSARIAATQATQSAQDQLTQATEAQTKAEQGLHDARVQAVQDLQDLDNKLKDNTISQAQAAINLKLAQQTLAVTLNAPGASQAQYSNQVAQARLNVAAAQQKVNELTLTGTRLAADDAKAHKNGVNNAPAVVSAQQALIDANHKLAEAQANIGITAQKNAIALQQAALSMSAAAGGTNAFATAMAKLNPIQRQFVDFLLTLKPLLDQIKLAASQFLPGLEQGIKNAAPAFGPILGIIGNIAKAMGSVFADIGAQFATPQGQKFLAFLSVELPKQIIFLGNLFVGLGKILSGIFEAAGPLIAAFDQAFVGALNNIGKGANGAGLQSFFASLLPIVKPTFTALGAVGQLIGAILKAIAPALPPVLKVITELAKTLTTLVTGQAGHQLVVVFIDLFDALGPVIRVVGQLFVDLPQLAPILLGIALAVKAWSIAQGILNLVLEANPIVLIVTAIGALVVAFIEAYKHSQTFREIVQAAFAVIGDVVRVIIGVFETFGGIVAGVFKTVGDSLSWVWINVIKPIFGFIKTVAIDPLSAVFQGLAKAWKALWDGIGTVLSWVWTNVIKPILGTISAGISAVSKALNVLQNGFTETVNGKGSVSIPPGYTPPAPHKASGGPVFAGVAYRANEFGPEMFIPQVDGTLINAVQSGHVMRGAANGAKSYTFNNYGQSDPVATSHQVANRFAARGV